MARTRPPSPILAGEDEEVSLFPKEGNRLPDDPDDINVPKKSCSAWLCPLTFWGDTLLSHTPPLGTIPRGRILTRKDQGPKGTGHFTCSFTVSCPAKAMVRMVLSYNGSGSCSADLGFCSSAIQTRGGEQKISAPQKTPPSSCFPFIIITIWIGSMNVEIRKASTSK